MSVHLCTAPCCWGVDDVNNPHLPPWQRVLDEAAAAGYHGIELGPLGYLPQDPGVARDALGARGLQLVAGTIFDNLVDASNLPSLLRQAHAICALLKQMPAVAAQPGQAFPGPYLVIIDWGHEVRDYSAGHPGHAPRLDDARWQAMMSHIRTIAELAWQEYGVRAVVHPHAGGYLEFADELARLVDDIPHSVAGLCLDTGHLHYAGMDPVAALRTYAQRLDYLHFKDIDACVFDQVLGERIRFFDACARGVMCPIGQGVIDYPALRKLLDELGYQGFITLEQERDPRNAGSSLDDVATSRRYLTQLGFDQGQPA